MNQQQFEIIHLLVKLPKLYTETFVLQNGITENELLIINEVEFKRHIRSWLSEYIDNAGCVEKLARMQLAERIREICNNEISKGVKLGSTKDEIQKQILSAIENLEMTDVVLLDNQFCFITIDDIPALNRWCCIELEQDTIGQAKEYLQALCFGSYHFTKKILNKLMKITLEKVTHGPEDGIRICID